MELLPRRPALGSILVLSTLLLGACNSLTGAQDLELVDPDDSFGSAGSAGSAGTSDGTGPGHTTGQGGSSGSAQGGSSQGGSAQGGSAQGGSSQGGSAQGGSAGNGGVAGEGGSQGGQGGSTTTSSTTSTTTGGPVDCVYPSGNFGDQIGNYVSGNLTWQGYAEKSAQSGSLSIQDYFDCDGSRGINALLIINSATWCGVCQEEATDLPSHAAEFASKGIRVLTLMVENINGQPASLATATQWRDNFGLDAYSVCADPDFTFAGNGSVGLPLQIIVDPRTMKIVGREEGFGDYSAVTSLANKNMN